MVYLRHVGEDWHPVGEQSDLKAVVMCRMSSGTEVAALSKNTTETHLERGVEMSSS